MKKIFFVSLSLLLVIGGGILLLENLSARKEYIKVEKKLAPTIKELGLRVEKKKMTRKGFSFFYGRINLLLPREVNLDKVPYRIIESLSSLKIYALKEKETKNTHIFIFRIGTEKEETHLLRFIYPKLKIALVVDDAGYHRNSPFLSLPFPLTISIIPGTPYGKTTAEEAKRRGKEIMLHFPMQPKEKKLEGYKFFIKEGMEKKEIKREVEKALQEIPYVRGVNNHMGSLVTEREELLSPFLELLKERNLYFVDSRTSLNSIAFSLAQKKGIPSTYNRLFLDNEANKEYIKKMWQVLLQIAMQQGSALGIIHEREETYFALKEILSEVDGRRICLVYASDLVE